MIGRNCFGLFGSRLQKAQSEFFLVRMPRAHGQADQRRTQTVPAPPLGLRFIQNGFQDSFDGVAEMITQETRKYPGRELEAKLLAADVACGSVRTVGDIVREPHVKTRGILEEAEYPAVGKVVAVKTPLFLSGKAAPLRRRAPFLGEHTGEVLKELGYSDAEIENLIRTGVARQPGSK